VLDLFTEDVPQPRYAPHVARDEDEFVARSAAGRDPDQTPSVAEIVIQNDVAGGH
jgi:hypothetical protein